MGDGGALVVNDGYFLWRALVAGSQAIRWYEASSGARGEFLVSNTSLVTGVSVNSTTFIYHEWRTGDLRARSRETGDEIVLAANASSVGIDRGMVVFVEQPPFVRSVVYALDLQTGRRTEIHADDALGGVDVNASRVVFDKHSANAPDSTYLFDLGTDELLELPDHVGSAGRSRGFARLSPEWLVHRRDPGAVFAVSLDTHREVRLGEASDPITEVWENRVVYRAASPNHGIVLHCI